MNEETETPDDPSEAGPRTTSRARLTRARRVALLGSWELELAIERLCWCEQTGRILGREAREGIGPRDALWAALHPEDRPLLATAIERCATEGLDFDVEVRVIAGAPEVRWVRLVGALERDGAGAPERVAGTLLDISARRRNQLIQQWEARILEAISSGQALSVVLEGIARGTEEVIAGAFASILLLDSEHGVLRHGAASSLPEGYVRAIGAVAVGPAAGSCGTAAFCREAVVVTDIATDPLWSSNAELPLAHGLRACWSIPVIGGRDQVLGTVAVYYGTARAPEARDLTLMNRVAQLVAIAIEREERERALAASEERFRRVFANAAIGLVVTRPGGAIVEANTAFCEMLGRSEEALRGQPFASIVLPEDLARHEESLHELREGRRGSLVVEMRYLHRTGRPVWIRTSLAIIPHEDGRGPTMIGVAEDVTARRLAQIEAEKSEALLRIASRVGRMGAWSVDLASLEWAWTEEARVIHGVAPEGSPSLEELLTRYPRPDRDRILDALQRCASRGMAVEEEGRLTRPNGEEIWVRIIGEAGRGPSGEIERIQGAIQDITERKLAETSLAESEARFRLLSDATNDVIWDWDLVSGRRWWGENLELLLGEPRGSLELTARSWIDRIHPGDRDQVLEALDRLAVGTADHWSAEYRFGGGPGRWVYVLDRGRVLRDGGGRPVRMVGGMTNLTERRRVEERLREQAALLDAAQDAITVRTLEDRVVYWNRSAERLYGWSAEEATGRAAGELLQSGAQERQEAHTATRAKGSWTGELENSTRDGRTVTVISRWTLVRSDAGEPRSIMTIETDITEQKRLEQKFLRAQRLESVGALAGGIAHDINNVLTPILLTAGLLAEEEQVPERREDIRRIETCAQRGAAMVRHLLSFARGTDGRRSRVNLGRMTTEIGQIVRDTFPKDIELVLGLEDGLWHADADPTQMHQLMMNLCVNARDAMPRGGTLRISGRNLVVDEVYAAMLPEARPGSFVVLTVEDSGTGIAPELLEKIFDPFFTTKEVGKGTGLGLATVQAIVQSHRGFIDVSSEVGRGTKMSVYLPAALEAEASAPQGGGPSVRTGARELLLVVDDEEHIRSVLRRTLERGGYRVLLAGHGAEAISLFARHESEVALVLTDMSMPVMDGPATVMALRAMRPELPIVGMSGLVGSSRLAQEACAEVASLLAKPFSAEAVLETVAASLGRRAAVLVRP